MATHLIPVVVAGASLLVVAGVPKVATPKPLARALATAGLPHGLGLVRAFAALEVVVGVAAVLVPGRVTGLLLGLLYLAFSGFVAAALARGGVIDSCGCFGKADTPPTRSHLAVTVLFALSGLAIAQSPPARPWWADDLGLALSLAALSALVAMLAWMVMAVLPTVTPEAVRSISTAEPGGGAAGPGQPRRGQTFALTRPTPAPLPDPTFPPRPQKG